MEARTDSRTHGEDVLSWEDQDSEMSWMLQASSDIEVLSITRINQNLACSSNVHG